MVNFHVWYIAQAESCLTHAVEHKGLFTIETFSPRHATYIGGKAANGFCCREFEGAVATRNITITL